ncbi:MAG: hypothetical protein KDG55_18625 [Rhodocyclaceae bacterium]|nr:hypothetical protein [Rhodocyclaceae bacterium]
MIWRVDGDGGHGNQVAPARAAEQDADIREAAILSRSAGSRINQRDDHGGPENDGDNRRFSNVLRPARVQANRLLKHAPQEPGEAFTDRTGQGFPWCHAGIAT